MFYRIIQQLGRRRLTRLRFLLAALLIAGGVLISCLPALVASRLVWPHVLAHITQDLDATVTTRDVTLSWFAPVVIRELQVDDRSGQTVATLEAVRTQSSLLSLLLHEGDFGTIRLERPRISVRLRLGGSNLEDVLAPYLARSDRESTGVGTLQIADGTVVIEDATGETRSPARLEAIQAVVSLGKETAGAGSVLVESCRAMRGENTAGTLQAVLAWQKNDTSTAWSLTTQTQALELAALEPLVTRFGLDLELAGELDLTAEITGSPSEGSLEVALRQAEVKQLRVAAPDYLGQDRLSWERLAIRGTYTSSRDSCRLSAAELTCDAGNLTADGTWNWPATFTADALWEAAQAARVQLSGNVDLARLAAVLPHTLRIREGALLESGAVAFRLGSTHQPPQRQWTANVRCSDLAVLREGKRFTWDAPLQITLEADRTTRAWRISRLDCSSSVLSLTGQGAPETGSFTLRCNLRSLFDQLQEFLDLGGLNAAGELSGQLDWKRDDAQGITIHGTSLLKDLAVTYGNRDILREPQMSLTMAMDGEVSEEGLTAVRTARFALASNTDRLELHLLDPVTAPGRDTIWSVGCQAQGESSTWLTRLQPLLAARTSLAAHTWTTSGPITVDGTARISSHGVEVERAAIRCEPFLFDSPRIHIDERAIVAEVEGRWDLEGRRLRIPEAVFQSEALAFRISDLRVEPRSTVADLTGDVTFRADLDRLHQTWQVVGKQRVWRLSGSALGQISMVRKGSETDARWTVDLVGVELAHRQAAATTTPILPATRRDEWTTVWREPSVKFAGSGQSRDGSRMIVADRLELSSADKLKVSLQGSVTQPLGACEMDVQGDITYDLAQIIRQWAPSWETYVRWHGQDTQRFRLRGPLFEVVGAPSASATRPDPAYPPFHPTHLVPESLEGDAALRWQSADLLGIAAGPGSVAMRLETGVVRTGLVEIPLSGGTLRLEPTLQLNHSPPLLSCAPGEALTDVEISPDMCQHWLKYIAPVAAEATRAQGRFSLSLDNTAIPLRQPSAAQATGVLAIESGSLGPGPLAQQLITVADAIRSILRVSSGNVAALGNSAWVSLPSQNTRFQVANQRVYHDRLVFEVGGATVYTQGHVGFDQSLSLLAQIPLRDEWLAREPKLAALRGQTVSIPITGTLSNPQLDQRGLERLAADAVRQVTGQLLEDELRKGLQRLIGPGS